MSARPPSTAGAHTHTHTHAHTHTHTHTSTNTHTHTRTHTHTHTHTECQIPTNYTELHYTNASFGDAIGCPAPEYGGWLSDGQRCNVACTEPYMDDPTLSTHTRTRTRTHSRTHTHTHTHTHIYTHTLTRTHTHPRAHTRHTHTYTGCQIPTNYTELHYTNASFGDAIDCPALEYGGWLSDGQRCNVACAEPYMEDPTLSNNGGGSVYVCKNGTFDPLPDLVCRLPYGMLDGCY